MKSIQIAIDIAQILVFGAIVIYLLKERRK
jgi:hypothetical protein